MNRIINSKQGLTGTAARLRFNTVTHCLFDMDGLLLDTESLYTEATQKVLDPYGETYTWGVKLTLMGLQNREVSERIVESYGLPITWEEYSALQRKYAEKLMCNAQLMPDTEPIYEKIVGDIAKSLGKPYPYETRMRIMGTTETMAAEIAIQELSLPITTDKFLKQFSALSRERLCEAEIMKGVERLIRHLYQSKVPFCLATSSGEEMVEVKTKNHKELFSLFQHKVCGSSDQEVKEGKPAPDIFLVAASRFSDKPSPEKCLVFEDSPNGVKAARTAGMQVVMVPDSHVPAEMCSEATIVLKSLEDFKPEHFGLPPYPIDE